MRLAVALFVLGLANTAWAGAPTARPMQTTVSDSDLLSKNGRAAGGGSRRVRAHGVVKDEVDDYNDFDDAAVKNRDNNGLKAVTYQPITQKYDIPKHPESATLSPVPIASDKLKKNTQLYTWSQPVQRKGYYFMHYPWNMLPKQYRIRPSYEYVYPPQYQNTVYSYPSNPYQDPYGVYRNLIPCGSYGSYGCGYQSAGGCGGGGCGGGCGGGSGGYGGGCGDREGYSGDDEEETSTEEDETSQEGGRSGETGQINKKDPLDDLDLEDLEKLDKDKGEEETKKKQKKH